jgi:hypothetical protein
MLTKISCPECKQVFPVADRSKEAWFKCPHCPAKVVNLNALVLFGSLAPPQGKDPVAVSGCTVALGVLGICALSCTGLATAAVRQGDSRILLGGILFWVVVPLVTFVIIARVRNETLSGYELSQNLLRTYAVAGVAALAGILFLLVAWSLGVFWAF